MADNIKVISKKEYYTAVGRRREAHANVRLYPVGNKREITVQGFPAKKGDMVVNKKRIAEYFPGAVNRTFYMEPFEVTKTKETFVTSVQVAGGGKHGQMEATVHGIARALELVDPTFRKLLKPHGLMMRDPRVKERRKAGLAHKARAKKQSPKR